MLFEQEMLEVEKEEPVKIRIDVFIITKGCKLTSDVFLKLLDYD